MSGEALCSVGQDYVQKVGGPTLKALGLAVVAGGVTFIVAHKGSQASIEGGVLVAIVVAVVVLLSLLALAVDQLDRRLNEARTDITIVNQNVGAHKAIAAWVNNCEMSLARKAKTLSRNKLVAQELELLEHNTLDSLPEWRVSRCARASENAETPTPRRSS